MKDSKTLFACLILGILVASVSFAQEYNVTRYEYDQSIIPLRDQLWVNLNSAAWVLDLYNGSAEQGDQLVIVETVAEDGTPYIWGYSIDGEIFIGRINEEKSWRLAIVVDYYNSDGYKVATLAQNREQPWLFDIDRKFIRFWLPGEYEDYEISSRYGPRDRPVSFWGGPDIDFHRGLDHRVQRGVSIIPPVYSGIYSIGYTRTAGNYLSISHQRYVYEEVNDVRQRVFKNYTIGIFHLDDWPEHIIEAHERYKRFRENIRKDPEQIIQFLVEELFKEYEEQGITEISIEQLREDVDSLSLDSNVWIEIPTDPQIGYTGLTGKTGGTHVHFEIGEVVPGENELQRFDPEPFLDRYMLVRDYTGLQMLQFIQEFREITE